MRESLRVVDAVEDDLDAPVLGPARRGRVGCDRLVGGLAAERDAAREHVVADEVVDDGRRTSAGEVEVR